MRPLIKLCLLVFVLIMMIIPAGAAARPSRHVSGPWIIVNDLVRNCAGAVCDVEVTRSPLPGRVKVVRKTEVIAAIEKNGARTAKLVMPKSVKVTRLGRMVKSKEINLRVEDAVRDILPSGVVIEKLGSVSGGKVPKEGFEIKAQWPLNELFRRKVAIPVEFVSGGEFFRKVNVIATLSLELNLPVAARNLETGTIIDSGAIEWRSTKVDRAPQRMILSADKIVGKKLRRAIRAGGYFINGTLASVPVILRNQPIIVTSKSGVIRITAHGIARQNGAAGDRIRVQIPSVNKLLWAMVTGPGRAVVSQ